MSNTNMTADRKTEILIEKTVRATLLSMGFNIADPEELVEYQKDQHYLRASRKRTEYLGNNSLQHIIYVVISGTIAAALVGAANMIGIRT